MEFENKIMKINLISKILFEYSLFYEMLKFRRENYPIHTIYALIYLSKGKVAQVVACPSSHARVVG